MPYYDDMANAIRDPSRQEAIKEFDRHIGKSPLLAAPYQPVSKALTPNPKDLFGSVKVSFTKLPAIAIAHGAHAMMDGANKYGAYNWRDKKVIASIYVDAAVRHLLDWFEGQEQAVDSEVHHIGHAIACCAILLDAQETGNLIDDRPNGNGHLDYVLTRLSGIIKRRKEASERDAGWVEGKVEAPDKVVAEERAKVLLENAKAQQQDERKQEHRESAPFCCGDSFPCSVSCLSHLRYSGPPKVQLRPPAAFQRAP
jgi:hypothetical protein